MKIKIVITPFLLFDKISIVRIVVTTFTLFPEIALMEMDSIHITLSI